MRYLHESPLSVGMHQDTHGTQWAWGVAQLETGKYCLCIPFGHNAYRGLIEFDSVEEATQWFVMMRDLGIPIEHSEDRVECKE